MIMGFLISPSLLHRSLQPFHRDRP